MKIALDCRSVYPGMGGIGRYTSCLLEELLRIDAQNNYVCYFTHLARPETLKLPSRAVVRIFQAGMIDERFDQLILPTVLEEDRATVYHNPTFSAPIIRTRAKVVSTVHDVVFRRFPDLVEPRLCRYLDGATTRACRHADAIVTVSEYSKRELLALYPVAANRVRVIYNGICAPPAQLMNRSSDPSDFILYVGSIEAKKNIDVLLEGFRVARSRGLADVRLALAGARPSDYPLQSRIEKCGLAGLVDVLGYVPEEKLEELYAKARLFVYPSLYEGFGFPPLEAMARGVPTIVSDASSLPEVVGDAALTFQARNPEQLADRMVRLIQDAALRAQLADKGPRRASEFRWQAAAAAHLKLYREVAAA